MTKDKKIELARKFVNWLKKSGCNVNISTSEVHADIKIFEVVMPAEDGTPYNTICYTSCELQGRSIDECWAEIIERRCAGHLALDRFDILGLGKAETLEEFALKLEIIDVD